MIKRSSFSIFNARSRTEILTTKNLCAVELIMCISFDFDLINFGLTREDYAYSLSFLSKTLIINNYILIFKVQTLICKLHDLQEQDLSLLAKAV